MLGGPSDLVTDPRETASRSDWLGVAFLLVTFLWPRKEKSLAKARRAGETPMRLSRINIAVTAGSALDQAVTPFGGRALAL
ncbi:hypothetical protein G114_01634 [Aeromonas diversa CDC 2478-85]|uniref:Uncharacterized protein n=1 Tax=Aeromonas diversa CDC 2478-85 TaxID=1268237 RepID=N9U5N8_9GAMM|nr:hypothetical protein G114_01634 [Aeromonas diversa CDC 2478-85]